MISSRSGLHELKSTEYEILQAFAAELQMAPPDLPIAATENKQTHKTIAKNDDENLTTKRNKRQRQSLTTDPTKRCRKNDAPQTHDMESCNVKAGGDERPRCNSGQTWWQGIVTESQSIFAHQGRKLESNRNFCFSEQPCDHLVSAGNWDPSTKCHSGEVIFDVRLNQVTEDWLGDVDMLLLAELDSDLDLSSILECSD